MDQALYATSPGGRASSSKSSGALTDNVRAELDALLTETRYQAILEALEVWRRDPGRPREGILALEQMAAAGPQPQTFDWPDLDYPATLSEVCGALIPSPSSAKGSSASRQGISPNTVAQAVAGVG